MTFISSLDQYKAQMQAGSFAVSFEVFANLVNQRWVGLIKPQDEATKPENEASMPENVAAKMVDDLVFQVPINGQIQDQLDLMSLVQKIHRSEESKEIQDILQSGISVKSALEKASHIGRAHGIYVMPNANANANANANGALQENDHRLETVVIGDLHSDSKSLQAALVAVDFFEKVATHQPIRLIFMGDYVDRGKEHIEIIDWILALKYVFPHQVYLLRGNHDGGFIENNGVVKTPYRIPDEDEPLTYFPPFIRALELRNPSIMENILPHYLAFFESMAMVAVFKHHGKVYLACHGGILRPTLGTRILTEDEMTLGFELLGALEPDLLLPRSQWYDYINQLSCLTRSDVLDEVGRSRCQNLFWSDPTTKHENLKWHTGRFQFTEEHFRAYAEKLEFDVLLRGHQVVGEGVQEVFGGDCKTIYSTGGQLLKGENQASAYGEVLPKVGVITEKGFEGRRI